MRLAGAILSLTTPKLRYISQDRLDEAESREEEFADEWESDDEGDEQRPRFTHRMYKGMLRRSMFGGRPKRSSSRGSPRASLSFSRLVSWS